MTNQEVVRALAVKVPVSSPVRSYRYIYEYCIVADEAGNTMNVAGLIDENGVLKYVDIQDLSCAELLPAELPVLEWPCELFSVSDVIQMMRDRVSVLCGKAQYKRIKAISLMRTPHSENLRYRVVLLDVNGNSTVTVDPSNLKLPDCEHR